jgi:hypothetical protein
VAATSLLPAAPADAPPLPVSRELGSAPPSVHPWLHQPGDAAWLAQPAPMGDDYQGAVCLTWTRAFDAASDSLAIDTKT